MRKQNPQSGEGAILLLILGGIVALVIFVVMMIKLTQIEPGNVGVSVEKCGKARINPEPIPVGYYWRDLFCENVIEYPTNLQTIVLAGPDSVVVTSSEGMQITVEVSLSFTLNPKDVPKLYEQFRQDLDHLSQNFVRQTVREALQSSFSKHTAEQIYSTARETSRSETQSYISERLGQYGFKIVQFTINRTTVPKPVTDAIEAKTAMIQQAQRANEEVKKKTAEADQAIAVARGVAEAKKLEADSIAYYNKTVAASLTPEFVQYKAIDKWSGFLPTYSGGGAVPFINMNPTK